MCCYALQQKVGVCGMVFWKFGLVFKNNRSFCFAMVLGSITLANLCFGSELVWIWFFCWELHYQSLGNSQLVNYTLEMTYT